MSEVDSFALPSCADSEGGVALPSEAMSSYPTSARPSARRRSPPAFATSSAISMSEVDSFALPSCADSVVESFALPSEAMSSSHHIDWEEEDLLPVPRPRELRQAASSFSIGTSAID
eukprot:11597072-Heterocapsa_arctica.AAC.1